MSIDVSQVIIQIIAFLLMLWILKKIGWKPILKMLQDRHNKIKSEFDTIDMNKKELDYLAEEYQAKLKGIEAESRHKIQEGVAKGRMIALKIQEEAQTTAREIVAKAKAEVEKEVSKARNQLKNDLVNMVMSISEKVIQNNLDNQKQKKLITDLVEVVKLE